MDKITKNKLAMYKSLKTVITSNQAEWEALPAFASAVQSFNNLLAKLEQAAYKQNLSMIGVSAVKNAKRAQVVEKSLETASALIAYGVVTNNVELINLMKVSRTALNKASRDRILILVDRIIASANEHLNNLAPYGVDQAGLSELQTLRDELDGQLNAPRNAIIDRQIETKRIKTLSKQIDEVIHLQLDKLVVVLKTAHPAFYINYKLAKEVIDLRKRPTGGAERDDGSTIPTTDL